MNNISNSFKIAFTSLQRNKARTLLTVLGIVIGIGAVIIVLSAGGAIKTLIVGELESFGTNIIQVEVKTPQTSQTSTANSFSMVGGSVITSLKEADGIALAKHENAKRFYAGVMGQELASYESEFKKAMLFGTSASFIDIDASTVEYGRFYTEEENQGLSKVTVLGFKLNKSLFGDGDSLGQSIKIGKEKFTVIGVLEERGASFSLDMDNMAFMPLRTLQKRLLGVDYVSFMIIELYDQNKADATADDFIYTLRQNHKITDPDKDDFAVTTMEQMMNMVGVVITGIQFLLIALGSISLIVGGVGIMNIMYVSVTERTFEIGLRKSLGAKYKNILWQFLSEAIILTIIGGIIGIIFGILFSWLVSIAATSQGFDWPFSISWGGLVTAVVVSGLVGIIFGLYPARQAARKDVITALRHE
jgi:putative ABC transport system permease protein